MPFHGDESFRLKKNLKILINNYFSQIKLNVVFSNNFNIKSFFKFKDKIPDALRSNVVYKYKCDSCNAVYIGKTSRHFSTRVKEHLGISFLTNLTLTSPPFSAIRNHINNSNKNHDNYNLTMDQFNIITSANSELELLIKESLLIKTHKPTLNNMESLNLKII